MCPGEFELVIVFDLRRDSCESLDAFLGDLFVSVGLLSGETRVGVVSAFFSFSRSATGTKRGLSRSVTSALLSDGVTKSFRSAGVGVPDTSVAIKL